MSLMDYLKNPRPKAKVPLTDSETLALMQEIWDTTADSKHFEMLWTGTPEGLDRFLSAYKDLEP